MLCVLAVFGLNATLIFSLIIIIIIIIIIMKEQCLNSVHWLTKLNIFIDSFCGVVVAVHYLPLFCYLLCVTGL